MHTADQMAAIYENKRWETQGSKVKSTRNPNGRPSAKGKLSDTFSKQTKTSVNVFDAFKDIVED